MAKLYIAKNRAGKCYAKIKNKYQNCEKIVSVNLPEGVDLPKDFGYFDCEYFLSCYKRSDGSTEICIIITKLVGGLANVVNPEINPAGTQSVSPYAEYENASDDLPF